MNMMRARGRHLTALITLCAGVMLTFELFVMVRGAERRQAEFEFKALSRDRIDHFIDRIDDNLHELYDVGSFYDASREVERGGFGVFARRILARHPNILAFAWIPRVTGDWREQLERAVRGQGLTDFRISELDRNGRMVRAGQRELYFPILYVEPFEANRAIWGYDLFSDSVRREAMEKACDTGDQVATARISLIGGGGGDFGCRVFLPIYRKDAPRATIEERRRSLTGFVSVLFRIGEMLDLSMRNLVPRGIDIYLYDKTDPKNVLFLYYSPSPLRKKFAGKGGGEADTSDGFQMVNDFEVAGRTWSIVSRACPEFYSSHRIWWSWFVLAAGLLLTFLLAAYFAEILSRADRIKTQVDERTAALRLSSRELAKSNEELMNSEARFRTLFDSAMEGILLADVETTQFFMCNKAMCRMLGYDEGELTGLSVKDIHPERDLPDVMEQFEKFVREEIQVAPNQPVMRKDGSIIYVDISAKPVILSGRKYLVGMFRDITERKKMEELLARDANEIRRSAEEWLRTFDSISDPIFIQDRNFTITKVNSSFAKLLGRAPRDIIGKKCYELLHGMDRPWPGCPYEKTLKDRKSHTDVIEDPKIGIPLLVTTSPILDEQGEITGSVHFAKDITQAREAEKELKDAVEMKSDFVCMVSHELRTPLAAIKEGIGLVADGIAGRVNKKQEEFLGIAMSNVDRLARLINEVLDFRKMEAGMIELGMRENDLNRAAREVHATMLPLAREKGLKLAVHADERLPIFKFDKDRIVQVLINIIGNAIKYTEKGSIIVSTARKGNVAAVTVQDTGIGIDGEDLPKLFRSFGRLSRGKYKNEGGTGLGLAISKQIIEAHRGRIWVESAPPSGSTFNFILPIEERRS